MTTETQTTESPIPTFNFPAGARVTLAQLLDKGFSHGHIDYLVDRGQIRYLGVFNKVSFEVAA